MEYSLVRAIIVKYLLQDSHSLNGDTPEEIVAMIAEDLELEPAQIRDVLEDLHACGQLEPDDEEGWIVYPRPPHVLMAFVTPRWSNRKKRFYGPPSYPSNKLERRRR